MSQTKAPEKIRNIAIIAHIDHGKTTLVDALLKGTDSMRRSDLGKERLMDSDKQEQERGITIFAKPTSVCYQDYKINFIDTPGHGDFSGEVQRMLGLVQGVLLIVDAREGPMPQTRYVMREALKRGIHPIVVVNKVDRPHSTPWESVDKVFDLMTELGASDSQLDFKTCFTSAILGKSGMDPDDLSDSMNPLIDLIISTVKPPEGKLEDPFCLQVVTTGYNLYFGTTLCGRVLSGKVKVGMRLAWKDKTGKRLKGTVAHVRTPIGTERVDVEEIGAGDVVEIDGLEGAGVGDTLYEDVQGAELERLDFIEVDEPTLFAQVKANFSPFAGKEGDKVTYTAVRDRLLLESRSNISLTVRQSDGSKETLEVGGRGELHLAVVFETMRREGYELCVGEPSVVTKEIDGVLHEPWEVAEIIVMEDTAGWIIEQLTQRGGELKNLVKDDEGRQHMTWEIAMERLLGLRSQLQQVSRGQAQLFSRHLDFRPVQAEKKLSGNGLLISMDTGRATGYSLVQLQKRGRLFIEVGTEVYKKMALGINARPGDLEVNPTKAKQLTNFRTQNKDEALKIEPPLPLTLEYALELMGSGQWIELTPKSIRIFKV